MARQTSRRLVSVFALVVPLLLPGVSRAQGLGGATVSDSKVGYIDSAFPLSQFRLRYDAGYDNNRASRAEFFYARTGPSGPGLPFPETRVDHQDASVYLEQVVRCGLSLFVDVPVRWINPQINDNSAGLSDVNLGFKWAFVDTGASVGTFLLRAYAPSGDADRGLGTHHVALEPGVLFYQQLGAHFGLEGELKYWIPIGGTDFSGNIIRYGLGLACDLWSNGRTTVSPVIEMVGWQVLDGQEGVVVFTPTGPISVAEDAAGDAIINLKLGVRATLGDRADVYAGYGRCLTGDRWYQDIFRLELRLFW